MKSRGLIAALAAVGVVVLCSGSLAQVKKGKTRPLMTKQLMAGAIGPQYTALNKALEGTGPADDKAWADAATLAALLNESTYTMMEDGRCPDEPWKSGAEKMRAQTALVLEKLNAKDAAGAKEAMMTVGPMGCRTCHMAHRK